MIYDEGFDIEFEELSFFAFSKYEITQNNYVKSFNSQCYSTCIGWYHNKDKTQWGCYIAEKVGKNPLQITYSNSKNIISILQPPENIVIEPMRFKSISTELMHKKFLKKEKLSLLSLKEAKSLVLNSNFNQHHLYVNNHLNHLKKNWEASVHPDFSTMSIKELNKFAGIHRNNINKIVKEFMSFK